jgi:anti-sigma B factor antagonist
MIEPTSVPGPEASLQLTMWSPQGGVVVAELDGELDIVTAPRVTTQLRAETKHGVPHLVLDLTSVTLLASHGVQMIVTALAEAGTLERVYLVGVSGNRRVRRILELTGVGDLFAHHDDVDALLRALPSA